MSDETRSIPPVEPVLDPKKDYVEINSYVVFWGLFYAAIFTLAVGYLCLKIGQTVDAFCSSICTCYGYSSYFETAKCFCGNGSHSGYR